MELHELYRRTEPRTRNLRVLICFLATLPLGGCLETDNPWAPLNIAVTPFQAGIYRPVTGPPSANVLGIVGNHYIWPIMNCGDNEQGECLKKEIYVTSLSDSQPIYAMSMEVHDNKWATSIALIKGDEFCFSDYVERYAPNDLVTRPDAKVAYPNPTKTKPDILLPWITSHMAQIVEDAGHGVCFKRDS